MVRAALRARSCARTASGSCPAARRPAPSTASAAAPAGRESSWAVRTTREVGQAHGYRAAVALAAGAAASGRHELHRAAVLPRLVQHRAQHLGRLRAGDAVRPVDDEERHAGDAEALGVPLVGAHLVGVAGGGEDLARLVGVQAGVGGQPHQDVVGCGGLALGEGRAHQALLERVLHPALRGQVQQAVRVEGAAAAHEVEAEVEAVLRGCGRHRVEHLLRLLQGAAVLGGEVLRLPLGALGGRRGVELEGAPDDLDLVAVREGGERLLEAALPDVAPRADDVGPDLDSHDRCNKRCTTACSVRRRRRRPARSPPSARPR